MKNLVKQSCVLATACAFVIVAGLWTPASAQPPSQDRVLDKISFGYKFYRVSESDVDAVNFPLGFYVDADGMLGVARNLKWVAELSYATRSEDDEGFDIGQNVLFLGAGVKREFGTDPDLIPHAQLLVGLARAGFSASFGGTEVFSDSTTDFALKISGAVDRSLNAAWDVRAGAGYIRVFSDPGANILRLFVGLVRRLD